MRERIQEFSNFLESVNHFNIDEKKQDRKEIGNQKAGVSTLENLFFGTCLKFSMENFITNEQNGRDNKTERKMSLTNTSTFLAPTWNLE